MSIFSFFNINHDCEKTSKLSCTIVILTKSAHWAGWSSSRHVHVYVCTPYAEEVHNLHHNLQFPDGLLDENSEDVHNLQSPDEKMCSWRPSEFCLLDENLSIICILF